MPKVYIRGFKKPSVTIKRGGEDFLLLEILTSISQNSTLDFHYMINERMNESIKYIIYPCQSTQKAG
jgi:hypothetical protein